MIHPDYPFLKWGFLHSPFMIFIRTHNSLSDQELMGILGLTDYHLMPPPLPFLGHHVVFTDDGEWTHIADDYWYTLWHSPQTIQAINQLSQEFEVFRCSFGEMDDSFEFEYHRNGKVVRKFVFDHNPFSRTRVVEVDEGEKLAGEPDDFDELSTASENFFPTITRAMGIIRQFDPARHRYYVSQI